MGSPACRHPGATPLSCSTSLGLDIWSDRYVEPYGDVADGETYISGLAATVQLSVHAFRRPVCGLRLYGAVQLTEAGLDTTVDVRDGTTEDLEAYTLARHTDTWERQPDAD